jgi:hypothetical protein
MRAKLKQVNPELKRRRCHPVLKQGSGCAAWCKDTPVYYAMPGNTTTEPDLTANPASHDQVSKYAAPLGKLET